MPAPTTRTTPTARIPLTPRTELLADTALALLSERGMRGLTHRAVDEAAGLPQGSTSNHARTRLALLEAAVRRLADREAEVLGLPDPAHSGPEGHGSLESVIVTLAQALHRYLTDDHRDLLIARYELALEATRRPELRAFYDATGSRFTEPLVTLMRTLDSPAPERHALSLVAWSEGLLFAHAAGSYRTSPPSEQTLRTGLTELLRGMFPKA
ncbi:TetR/AcrR family transcriptional regulator [Streptomyces sp. NPDC050439]|uniref:TetR/AcrR family transcriptional regulator n=1 Tax=unclassified Streptomyces TaxID=2593676 RepID=UPI00343BD2E3